MIENYNPSALVQILLLDYVVARHGRTLRQGNLSQDEMKIVHGMMKELEDDGDISNMQLLDPPVNTKPARKNSERCNIGSRSYCPGEILFKYQKSCLSM